MAARREIQRQETEADITDWLKRHTGLWWRIPDIACACGLAVPTVNNALRIMESKGLIIKDTRRKRKNGKVYPVFCMQQFTAPTFGPSWLCPVPPVLTQEQIRGIRTVLGFTGDLRAKKALEDIDSA